MNTITKKELEQFPIVHGRRQCPTGDYRKIVTLGLSNAFSEFSVFRARISCRYSSFGRHCMFAKNSKFTWCQFGDQCEFEDGCIFENCIFGTQTHFGANCSFNKSCEYGSSPVFGLNCTFGELRAKDTNCLLICSGMFNINRTLYFFNTTEGLYVQAGCFFGHSTKFLSKTRRDCGKDLNFVGNKRKAYAYPMLIRMAEKLFGMTETSDVDSN